MGRRTREKGIGSRGQSVIDSRRFKRLMEKMGLIVVYLASSGASRFWNPSWRMINEALEMAALRMGGSAGAGASM